MEGCLPCEWGIRRLLEGNNRLTPQRTLFETCCCSRVNSMPNFGGISCKCYKWHGCYAFLGSGRRVAMLLLDSGPSGQRLVRRAKSRQPYANAAADLRRRPSSVAGYSELPWRSVFAMVVPSVAKRNGCLPARSRSRRRRRIERVAIACVD